MWKKDEAGGAPATGDAAPRAEAPRRVGGSTGERATIGHSITIRGDVTGDEDLLIQGRVEGSVKLEQHAITVGAEGHVHADITARVVVVEGQVEGDLTAGDQIVLRGSARVQGDVRAPRVVLEDGASFRGLVDMGAPKASDARAATSKPAAPSSVSSGATPSTPKTKDAPEAVQKAAT